MHIKKNKGVQTTQGKFYRALETVKHIFYVNKSNKESCLMYDRKMNLISNDELANEKLKEALDKGEYSWVSQEFLK